MRRRICNSIGSLFGSVSREDRCIAGIAGQIRKAREIAGKTKTQLARMLHVAPSTVTRLESGSRIPSVRMLVTIAFSTGLAVGYFFCDDDEDGAPARNRKHAIKYRPGDHRSSPLV